MAPRLRTVARALAFLAAGAHAQGGFGSGFGGLGGLPGLGGAGLAGFGTPQATAPAATAPPAQEEVDLACISGGHAGGWSAAKLRFQALLTSSAGKAPAVLPLQAATQPALSAALEGVVQDLKAVDAFNPQAADECGFGKLCLQLLSMAAIDDATALAQLFSAFEPLASPVLTMLLDVPWAVLGQTGWPLFGLLAQINLRKIAVPGAANTEPMDGLDTPEGKLFQANLLAGLAAGDGQAVALASSAFIQRELQGSALGSLTALAAQAVLTQQPQDRLAILQTLQQAFRQVIGSAAELDVALGTRWPLWSLLHASIDLMFV